MYTESGLVLFLVRLFFLTPTFFHISLVMSPFLSSLLFLLSLLLTKVSLASLDGLTFRIKVSWYLHSVLSSINFLHFRTTGSSQ